MMSDYEPGARRKKLAGYLKAANELRQTYTSSWSSSGLRDGPSDDNVPGAFPAAAIDRSDDEELVLFPSYARRHVKHRHSSKTEDSSNRESWAREWEVQEDRDAIVDVDVRGWVFTPHTGPMTRKQRLFMAMARQLVGLPGAADGAQTPNSSLPNSRSTSPSGVRDRIISRQQSREEEMAAREAEAILQRGEKESKIAQEGGYSEQPGSDASKWDTSPPRSNAATGGRREPDVGVSSSSTITSSQQRKAWKTTAEMTAAELATANEHLLARLKPFLANPCISIPISAFFYSESRSAQRTVDTDASGHFQLRAALDFVPTHVRILASETLSATQEVKITEPAGISLISDIDDTIKHSAISSGAREIFRNVFIRELGDLGVDGVREWYTQLAKQGIMMHYVSNSPWQLYPLLQSYFQKAGLPPGSFHLKQYSGMFQGIFEPVAERKKSSLEKIFRDFPERRFLLVGDSGEADLEVYTDVVLENPGRVLAIFIRDVTMPIKKGAKFDTTLGPLSGERRRLHTPTPSDRKSKINEDFAQNEEAAMREAIRRSMQDADQSDAKANRPQLPPRRPSEKPREEENLIDLDSSDDDGPPLPSTPPKYGQIQQTATKPKGAPPRPSKPASLSSNQLNSTRSTDSESGPPLPPRRPATLSQNDTAQSYRSNPETKLPYANRAPNGASSQTSTTSRSPTTPISTIRSMYNEVPFMSTDSLSSTTYPPANSYSRYYDGDPNPPNKKEELWKRRWARAREILDDKGVMLRAWRDGNDVRNESEKLVKTALAEFEKKKKKST